MTRKLLLSLVAMAVAVGAPGAGIATGATKTMGAYEFYFARSDANPSPNLTVRKNDFVKWVWRETPVKHNVKITRSGTLFYKSAVKESGSVRKKFTRTGTYTVICELHRTTMRGKVTVKK